MGPGPAAAVRPTARFSNRPYLAAIVTALLGAFMILRIVDLYGEFSATADEGNYLVCGIELYQRQTTVLNPQQPPLSRWAIGFLPCLAGLRIESGRSFFDEGKGLLEEAGDYWRTLTLARTGNLIFVPLLLFYVYRWASHLYGRTAGAAVVLLVSFSPAAIAHSAVATADLAVTASLTMAAFHASQWFRDRTIHNACWAGAGAGLALSPRSGDDEPCAGNSPMKRRDCHSYPIWAEGHAPATESKEKDSRVFNQLANSGIDTRN